MLLPPVGLPARTLGFRVAEWIERYCAIPDGARAGQPFVPSPQQLAFLAWFYALDDRNRFLFRRGLLVRPQKWGKGPLSAAIICAEAAGPVLYAGYDDDDGPVGAPWPTPWIQVVAVSEDQTDNIWTALVPMIELGDLKAEISDTGKTRINVAGAGGSAGLIEPVTSAAISRLGQRITFAAHDETQSWTAHNGGVKLADTQRRNLAGMGGRSLETTNAWDPAEESVAQTTFESNMDDVLVDYPDPPRGSIRNERDRRRILRAVYAGSDWVDLDRVDAEIEELLPRDPGQAERFFLNRVVAGMDKAFDPEVWRGIANAAEGIGPGRVVTLGFDGARRQDSTGLVATDVETGFQTVLGVWEKPRDVPEQDWAVDEDDVDAALADAFEIFDVWRMYADPPYWETAISRWQGQYGADRVVEWWTNRTKTIAYALRAFHQAMIDGDLTQDGNEAYARHIANAVRQSTRIRDPDTGGFLWVIRKDGAKSPRKIDLAMAGCLSWEARNDAIADGGWQKKTYSRASW